ncbi:MAG: hypothetical protein LBL17_01770 [Coxiellaceae bacterium]|jgi:hypothetical protein|nr:hypothetical protein [Coxiellaceae bacterium]
MFIKLTKVKQFTYVQLVKGYREGDKVKHKTILNFGRLDELQQDKSWKDSFIKLANILNGETAAVFDINKCSAKRVLNWGYIVYQKLWKVFGIDKILQTIQEKTRVNFDINNACCLMAINHLLNPHSKLGIL